MDELRVERGRYHDSVSLMRASTAAAGTTGVEQVLGAMATELNRQLLVDLGFDPGDAGPNDLVLAVRADDADAVAAAIAAFETELARRPTGAAGDDEVAARTVESAAERSGADVALVSVPGPHAFTEASAALDAGLHVMVFSDGVSLDHEVALKRRATDAGLLVMGPDCGTAIVGGVGLGFANVVRPGPVGIVAASGTGSQQLCCLLDAAGIGVRHVLGTGGRDLSAAVGGASTLAALAALDEDPSVEVIVLVSKPPDDEVAGAVEQAAAACSTPVITGFVGPGRDDLTAVAAAVAEACGSPFPELAVTAPDNDPTASAPTRSGGAIAGLFSGGTDASEAEIVLGGLVPAERLRIVDLGDDEWTAGRPHPMIDHRILLETVEKSAADPTVGVILLDVVCGHGAHPDPASSLAPAITAARAEGVAVVAALVATRDDPQGADRQVAALAAAGAEVHRNVAGAARAAARLAGGEPS
ncbi:MAG: FdrA family protein [Actinomycetota bacterium]|nr:FdrA family protein [Actinomycetota bacterium]